MSAIHHTAKRRIVWAKWSDGMGGWFYAGIVKRPSATDNE